MKVKNSETGKTEEFTAMIPFRVHAGHAYPEQSAVWISIAEMRKRISQIDATKGEN